MVDTERKKIRDTCEELDLTGPVEDVIDMLQTEAMLATARGFTDLAVVLEGDWDSHSHWHILTGDRLETDAELARRIKLEEKIEASRVLAKADLKRRAENKKSKELAEYERLKKIYG